MKDGSECPSRVLISCKGTPAEASSGGYAGGYAGSPGSLSGAQMRILWVYGGTRVARTFAASGQTVEYLSPYDKA